MTPPLWWISAGERGDPLPCLLIDCAGLERGASELPDGVFSDLECLFTGDLAEELADVSGYLARVKSWDESVYEAVYDLMARQVALLILFPEAPAGVDTGDAPARGQDFSSLHRHFRKFNVVYGPDGKPLFFRYYDPRILPSVLKVLDPKQLASFFGPCAALISLDQSSASQEMRQVNGELELRALPDGATPVRTG